MGLVKCKVHGLAGIELVCSHIKSSISLGRTFEPPIRVSLVRDENLDLFESMEGDFVYCSDCAKKFKLPLESCELPETNFLGFTSWDFQATCSRCFDELKKKL